MNRTFLFSLLALFLCLSYFLVCTSAKKHSDVTQAVKVVTHQVKEKIEEALQDISSPSSSSKNDQRNRKSINKALTTNICAGPPVPEKTVVSGVFQGAVNTPVFLNLSTFDEQGKPAIQVPVNLWKVVFDNATFTAQAINYGISYIGEGVYSLAINSKTAGKFDLIITLEGEFISKGPFQMFFQPGRPAVCSPSPYYTTATAGVPTTLSFLCIDSYRNQISCSSSGYTARPNWRLTLNSNYPSYKSLTVNFSGCTSSLNNNSSNDNSLFSFSVQTNSSGNYAGYLYFYPSPANSSTVFVLYSGSLVNVLSGPLDITRSVFVANVYSTYGNLNLNTYDRFGNLLTSLNQTEKPNFVSKTCGSFTYSNIYFNGATVQLSYNGVPSSTPYCVSLYYITAQRQEILLGRVASRSDCSTRCNISSGYELLDDDELMGDDDNEAQWLSYSFDGTNTTLLVLIVGFTSIAWGGFLIGVLSVLLIRRRFAQQQQQQPKKGQI